MFKRLLKWLKKSPEKKNSRELLKEDKSEIKGDKKTKRSKKNMPNEEVKTEEKVVEQKEEKKVPTAEEKDETPVEVEKEEKTTETETEQKPEVPPMEEEEVPAEEEEELPQVKEEQTAGNGIRLEDLVTKDELAERLQALEAKYEAVIKENQDLKDKYENKDFGNFQKQGMPVKDKQANSTFDEYSKAFM